MIKLAFYYGKKGKGYTGKKVQTLYIYKIRNIKFNNHLFRTIFFNFAHCVEIIIL